MAEETKKYKPAVTMVKGAEPLSVVVVAEAAFAILQAAKVDIDKASCYTVCTAGFAAFVAIRNWVKHRK